MKKYSSIDVLFNFEEEDGKVFCGVLFKKEEDFITIAWAVEDCKRGAAKIACDQLSSIIGYDGFEFDDFVKEVGEES